MLYLQGHSVPDTARLLGWAAKRTENLVYRGLGGSAAMPDGERTHAMTAPEPADVARLREALARLADEPGWPDVDSGRLFSALHGDVPPEERRAVVDELIRNPQAAAAWRLARELGPEEPTVVSALQWKWMSMAAMLLLVAGTAWLILPWRSEAPVFRGGEPRSIASLLPDDVPLSRAEPVLRWTGLEGARYRVRVLTPELALLDETEGLVPNRHTGCARTYWERYRRAAGFSGKSRQGSAAPRLWCRSRSALRWSDGRSSGSCGHGNL